jgi:hypothetical protein
MSVPDLADSRYHNCPNERGNCRWLRLVAALDAPVAVRKEGERILKVPEAL